MNFQIKIKNNLNSSLFFSQFHKDNKITFKTLNKKFILKLKKKIHKNFLIFKFKF